MRRVPVWSRGRHSMRKKTVAIGEKVYVLAENGETIDISLDADAPAANFKKALDPEWPEQ